MFPLGLNALLLPIDDHKQLVDYSATFQGIRQKNFLFESCL